MYYLYISVGSFFACIGVFIVENCVGIGWDYHPDSVTYLETSQKMLANILDNGPLSVFNNLYYVIVGVFASNVLLLVLLNMVFYVLTNIVLGREFRKYAMKNHISVARFWILLFFLLSNPYRAHLAVHVLKDTIVIFCLCMVVAEKKFRLLTGLIMVLLRLASVVYFVQFIKGKHLKFLVPLIVVFLFFKMDSVWDFLNVQNMNQMHFRDFDLVPNFVQYGEVGIFVRSIIWPFFLLSGCFILVSPSVMYLPIAIYSFIMQIWCLKALNSWGVTMGTFLTMSFFAMLVTGFTSYIRYCYPVLVVMPIFLMNNKFQYNRGISRISIAYDS